MSASHSSSGTSGHGGNCPSQTFPLIESTRAQHECEPTPPRDHRYAFKQVREFLLLEIEYKSVFKDHKAMDTCAKNIISTYTMYKTINKKVRLMDYFLAHNGLVPIRLYD